MDTNTNLETRSARQLQCGIHQCLERTLIPDKPHYRTSEYMSHIIDVSLGDRKTRRCHHTREYSHFQFTVEHDSGEVSFVGIVAPSTASDRQGIGSPR